MTTEQISATVRKTCDACGYVLVHKWPIEETACDEVYYVASNGMLVLADDPREWLPIVEHPNDSARVRHREMCSVCARIFRIFFPENGGKSG